MRILVVLLLGLLLAACVKEKMLIPDNQVTDIDGNIYNVVQIGVQSWMKENLRTRYLSDDTPIPEVRDNILWSNLSSPGYCLVNNISYTDDSYGYLYNWHAVNTGKLCPTGWHVPTDIEWMILEEYSGMSTDIVNTLGWRESGGELKATYGWSWNGAGTDKYGLSIIGTGYRYSNGNFENIGQQTELWTSTNCSLELALRRSFTCWDYGIYRGCASKRNGASVRCIKNN